MLLLERAIEEAKREKVGADWVIVGEGALPRRAVSTLWAGHAADDEVLRQAMIDANRPQICL
jgi:hypothetical protein